MDPVQKQVTAPESANEGRKEIAKDSEVKQQDASPEENTKDLETGEDFYAELHEAQEEIETVYSRLITDPMTYKLSWLRGWHVFWEISRTVWTSPDLWKMMAQLLVLSCSVGIAAYYLLPDPTYLNPEKFAEINHMLFLFVSLMLGFFLEASICRWLACVDGFQTLFSAVRSLGNQLHAHGVEQRKLDMCMRYCVLSVWFLHFNLRNRTLSEEGKKTANERMWREMEDRMNNGKFSFVMPEERELLEPAANLSQQMWTLVSSLLGRMSQDGDLPPLASPSWLRMLSVCTSADDGIRKVRMAIEVQMPFVYVHTLAALVHLTNILFAITLGLTMGAAMGGITHHGKILYKGRVTEETPVAVEVQTIIVVMAECILGGTLYQAFLQIGICIASPFVNESKEGHIPVTRLTMELEHDLRDQHTVANSCLQWEQPFFKPRTVKG